MAIVIDANMKMFADRMHITSSRMVQDYGLSTVDEVIEAEAERGNKHAILYAKEYYHSPEKLIKLFRLTDVENRFVIINKMDPRSRMKLLPYLSNDDLVMGLYFFTQEKLLEMLMETNIEELVRVALEAFPIEQMILMFKEEDLMMFFMHQELDKNDVVEQLKIMPKDMMDKFVECVTGMPANETNPMELIDSIAKLPDDKFHKFMAFIDPDVQRQLTFQLTKEKPEYLTLFQNSAYVDMLSTLQKPEMVKPMVMLNKETLIQMVSILPEDLLSIVASQIDTKHFAYFLQDGHMDLIDEAWMI